MNKKELNEYTKRHDYLANCRINETQDAYEKRLIQEKLERIQESATPQPVEWQLADYDVLDGSWCGIENKIFIDCGQSYKHHKHPLWVYIEFKNIKTKNPHAYYTCFYLPITVEKHPQIIGNIEGMGINPKTINNVKRFISGNVKAFKDIADMKVRDNDNILPIFMLKEEKVLTESPNFLKKQLALPVNIWIDPGSSPQHSIHIDGSQGEGGGQMLRSSLALSLITGKPFTIDNKVALILCGHHQLRIANRFN